MVKSKFNEKNVFQSTSISKIDILKDNKSVYNEDYYDAFSQTGSYNQMRPIQKSLRIRNSIINLIGKSSITLFSFGDFEKLSKFYKKFKNVYAYEINPKAVKIAKELSSSPDDIREQDITVKIDNPFPKTELSICYYVFEHLTDDQIKMALNNLMESSPIFIIKLTTVDDEMYEKDPYHINPKTSKEWTKFLTSYVNSFGFERIKTDSYTWCFVNKNLKKDISNIIKETDEKLFNTTQKYVNSNSLINTSKLLNQLKKK